MTDFSIGDIVYTGNYERSASGCVIARVTNVSEYAHTDIIGGYIVYECYYTLEYLKGGKESIIIEGKNLRSLTPIEQLILETDDQHEL